MDHVTKNELHEWKSSLRRGSKLCIVMEYAPKGTVHRLIQAGGGELGGEGGKSIHAVMKP